MEYGRNEENWFSDKFSINAKRINLKRDLGFSSNSWNMWKECDIMFHWLKIMMILK